MPASAPRPCTYPGCGVLVSQGARCPKHHHDKQRASANDRGYGSKWRKARERFLYDNPLCRHHEQQGQLVPATVVDHIIPHRGDLGLMWSQSNWQALCKPCHDKKTATEDGGFGR